MEDIPTSQIEIPLDILIEHMTPEQKAKKFREICCYITFWERRKNPSIKTEAVLKRYDIKESARKLGCKPPSVRTLNDWTRPAQQLGSPRELARALYEGNLDKAEELLHTIEKRHRKNKGRIQIDPRCIPLKK